jgi:hypothetical protein
MTAIEIIRRAMRLDGILGIGEAPTAEETNDCLLALNQMLSSWSLNALIIYCNKVETFTLTGGKSEYTWGVELDPLAPIQPDFNSERPDKIFRAYYNSAGAQNEIEQVNEQTYMALLDSASGGYPGRFTYIPSFPFGTVKFYPIPDSGLEISFLVFKKLEKIENVDDDLIIPPGYERAIAFNLAVEIAPEFGLEIPPSVLGIAQSSLANVKRMNIQFPVSQTDTASLGGISSGNFDINKG